MTFWKKRKEQKQSGRYQHPEFEQAQTWAASLNNTKYALLCRAVCQRLQELGQLGNLAEPFACGLGQAMLVNAYHRAQAERRHA